MTYNAAKRPPIFEFNPPRNAFWSVNCSFLFEFLTHTLNIEIKLRIRADISTDVLY